MQELVWIVFVQNHARCCAAIESIATASAAAAAGGGGVEPVIALALEKGLCRKLGGCCGGCICCHRWGQRPLNTAMGTGRHKQETHAHGSRRWGHGARVTTCL